MLIKRVDIKRTKLELLEPSKVIITCRHHISIAEQSIKIDGLPIDEALHLLKLEAERWNINIQPQDENSLKMLVQKASGIPEVLKWVMERVNNGNSMDSVLRKIEDAGAEELFEYVFAMSLSDLNEQTRHIFKSMAEFSDPVSIKEITAQNPSISDVEEHLSLLMSRSLLEDNRRLFEKEYTLHQFVRYRAQVE